MEKITCCFTGHRPSSFAFSYNESDPQCLKIKESIKSMIKKAYDNGYRRFISGMAIGVDTWAAEAVLEFRKDHHDVELIAAIPCRGQEKMWPQKSKDRWNRIVREADEVIFVSNQSYTPQCMDLRNRYMVDNSTYVLAVYKGNVEGIADKYKLTGSSGSGGTGNCIAYAINEGVSVLVYNPDGDIWYKL